MRIVAVELRARHPARLARFYAGLLGLELVRSTDDVVALRVGEDQLAFRRHPEPGVQHVAFHVSEIDADAIVAWLSDRADITAADDDAEDEQSRMWYFRDPERNVLELIAHRTLDWPEEGPRLRAIAEVGWPVSDMDAALELLERDHIRAWSGGSAERFAACGDRRGSVVVVPRTRTWDGSDDPAEVAPLRITVANERGIAITVPPLS